MMPLAQQLHIPTMRIEHTEPTGWTQAKIDELLPLRCNTNVFITDYSRKKWGFNERRR